MKRLIVSMVVFAMAMVCHSKEYTFIVKSNSTATKVECVEKVKKVENVRFYYVKTYRLKNGGYKVVINTQRPAKK